VTLFIVGLFVGALLGAGLMAIATAAGRADDNAEKVVARAARGEIQLRDRKTYTLVALRSLN
jgi:hypothetical protein